MADDARSVEADDEFQIELVDIADLPEEEWDDELRATIAKAEADIAAGRYATHAEVSKWLETWGTPDFGPAPRPWLK